jgi:hypothetical protein
VNLPAAEQAFLCSALAQLAPDVRPVFTARMIDYLQALADPDVGDVDRALRAAWVGLWTPPADPELHTSRWGRKQSRFERVSKRVW